MDESQSGRPRVLSTHRAVANDPANWGCGRAVPHRAAETSTFERNFTRHNGLQVLSTFVQGTLTSLRHFLDPT